MEHPIDFHRAIRRARWRFASPPPSPPPRWGGVRRPRRRRRTTWGEWRTMLLGGVLLGLIAAGGGTDRVVALVDRLRSGDIVAMGDVAAGGVATGGDAAAPATARTFGLCFTGGGTDCVVDGDTFWIDGTKIRIADIDTPETHPPRCAEEARLGEAATVRLRDLLNAGPVTLVTEGRSEDHYGRALRIVERDGVSLGQTLVDEGLARRWEGRRRPWC